MGIPRHHSSVSRRFSQPFRFAVFELHPFSKRSGTPAYIWCPAFHCRFRSHFRSRFRKNRVRTCRSVCRCWGVCAAVARQAPETGGRVSRAKEWAELQATWLRTERQVRKNRTRSCLHGSKATADLLTETENVIFT